MIYFITNEPQHLSLYRRKLYDNIEVLEDNEKTRIAFISWINEVNNLLYGFDKETNGLDAWKNDCLLTIIGDEQTQFIIHEPYADGQYYERAVENKEDSIILGHNIKFDIKYSLTKHDVHFTRVYDTMLAEQRLFMKSEMSMALASLCERYLDVFPTAMDKRIRNEFIGCDVKTFKVKPRHLYYGASDVTNLFPIKEKQEVTIEKYGMEYLIKGIEFPLIHIVAKAEVTGFEFNLDEWLAIHKENAAVRFELECKLDVEVRRLRDETWGTSDDGIGYIPEKRLYMIGGKWDKVRVHNPMYDLFNDDGSTNVEDLFGNMMSKQTYTGLKKKIKKTPNNIEFGSPVQIMEIFGRLEEPLLTKQENLVKPLFNKNQKVDTTHHNYQTNETAFHTYLTMLPSTRMKTFIELLLQFREVNTACNNFGANYKNKINPITNKLHTAFRQCFAATGRMQSGGGKKEPDKPNFQNIPSKSTFAIRMRNCFRARKGYSIGTHDLSGAELIIMCSLSQDMKLFKIAKGDMHTYIAEKCWRAIFTRRANVAYKEYQNGNNTDSLKKIIRDNIHKAKTFIITKILRTNFKPMTFGTIYGMYAAKAGKTLNIIKEEGQVVIDIIQREFPDVFRMVLAAADFARNNGYVILNKRTNSRMWFPNIIRVLKGIMSEKDAFMLLSKEMSEARNGRIQGTQADMIKECTVELQKWIDTNNFTKVITILSWVHDEIIDEHPNRINGKSLEWIEWKNAGNELYYNNEIYNNFPELKAQVMRNTCNKYLNNVQMEVDYEVEPYWTK